MCVYFLTGYSDSTTTPDQKLNQPKGRKTSLDTFQYVMNVYVDGTLCILGYFGNAMSFFILQSDKTKTSNTILLQSLAIFDSMFLTYTWLYVVLRSIYPYTGLAKFIHEVNNYIVAIVLPFGWTSQTCTIWLVMLMAIDRYLVVVYPLNATVWCSITNAKRIVICMAIFAALFNIPRWIHYYQMSFGAGAAVASSTLISHTSGEVEYIWNEELYRKVYHVSLTIIMLFLIPLTITIVLNTKLIWTIGQARKKRIQMQASNSRQKQQGVSNKTNTNLTLMVIIIISVFVICQFPDLVASVIGAGDFEVDKTTYSYYATCKEALLTLNSAINFFIYCIFYKHFREHLKRIVCFKKS